MSTLNVDIVNPQTGTDVTVSGVNIDDYNQSMKVGFATGLSLGTWSTAIGRYALNASTGTGNTGVGFQAGRLQTSGFGNTAVGAYAMNDMTTGSANTAIGYFALRYATISAGGGYNTAIGAQSLLSVSTGAQNTALGQDSGRNITTGVNNICIGFNAQATTATVSNQITLGNAVNNVLRCAVTSITSLSDARDKEDVAELTAGLEFINELNPVSFVWNDRDESGKHGVKDFGFIAQDLKATQEKHDMAETLGLVYEDNPEKLEASYGKLIPILVKAIKELSAKVEALESKKKK
jgi:hypothetical protein